MISPCISSARIHRACSVPSACTRRCRPRSRPSMLGTSRAEVGPKRLVITLPTVHLALVVSLHVDVRFCSGGHRGCPSSRRVDESSWSTSADVRLFRLQTPIGRHERPTCSRRGTQVADTPDDQERVSTTFNAPVSAARPNTSYASTNWSRAKWWVTNLVESSWLLVDEPQQRRCGVRVDEPGGDGHVA